MCSRRKAVIRGAIGVIIPRNVDLKDAHFNKTDIFSFSKSSKAAKAYDKLIRELFFDEPVVGGSGEEGQPQS
jgi:chromosome partitioning protein